MRVYPLLILLCAMSAGLMWGCTSGPGASLPLRLEIAAGDRQKDWALVYYQSWRQDKEPAYLRLAQQRMADAVKRYFDIQVKIGHSYPDFYIVDRKRRESCRYLYEMERTAMKYAVEFEDPSSEGCFR